MAENESAELETLRAEVERLRALVGPSEASYVQLQVDLLGARDAAIGAESEAGVARGYCHSLEVEVERLQRDFKWFRGQIVDRAKALRPRRPIASQAISRRSAR